MKRNHGSLFVWGVVLDVFLMRCLLGFDFSVCFLGKCDDTEGYCVFNLIFGDLSVVFFFFIKFV